MKTRPRCELNEPTATRRRSGGARTHNSPMRRSSQMARNRRAHCESARGQWLKGLVGRGGCGKSLGIDARLGTRVCDQRLPRQAVAGPQANGQLQARVPLCVLDEGRVIPVVLDKELCSHAQWSDVAFSLGGVMHVELTATFGSPEFSDQLNMLAQTIAERRKGLGSIASEAGEAGALQDRLPPSVAAGNARRPSHTDKAPPPVAGTRRPSRFLGGVRGLFFPRRSSAAVKR